MKNVNSVNNTLKDQLSRRFEYLRISVTDRCNFRCSYCMPSDIFNKDYKYIPHDRILSYEEIIDICKLLKKIGLKKIRITARISPFRSILLKYSRIFLCGMPSESLYPKR